MTRQDLLDVCVYGCVNANPTISANGVHYLWPGLTPYEAKASLERLAELRLVTPTAAGACSVLDVQWSAVKAE